MLRVVGIRPPRTDRSLRVFSQTEASAVSAAAGLPQIAVPVADSHTTSALSSFVRRRR